MVHLQRESGAQNPFIPTCTSVHLSMEKKKKKMLTDPLLCKIHPHTLRGTSSTDTVNIDTANEAEDKDRTLPV